MANKSFRVIGSERREFRDPLNLFAISGLWQFVLLFVLARVLSVDWGTLVYFLPVSVPFLLASCAAFIYLTHLDMKPGIREYHVTIEDDRDKGGGFLLSYRDESGNGRDSLVVRALRPRPNEPLWRDVTPKVTEPVEGTKASVKIYFRKSRILLSLGFPNETEMNGFCSRLGRTTGPRIMKSLNGLPGTTH